MSFSWSKGTNFSTSPNFPIVIDSLFPSNFSSRFHCLLKENVLVRMFFMFILHRLIFSLRNFIKFNATGSTAQRLHNSKITSHLRFSLVHCTMIRSYYVLSIILATKIVRRPIFEWIFIMNISSRN